MANFSPASIEIGGCLSYKQAALLCAQISQGAYRLGWGAQDVFRPKLPPDLVKAVTITYSASNVPRALLVLMDKQATQGKFYELEQFLFYEDIPFTRFTQPHDGCSGSMLVFRNSVQRHYDAVDQHPVIRQDNVAMIIDRLNQIPRTKLPALSRGLDQAIAELGELVGPPILPLPVFTVTQEES